MLDHLNGADLTHRELAHRRVWPVSLCGGMDYHATALIEFAVDLFFWIGIALVIDRLDLLIWLLAITQGAQLVIMLVKRSLEAWRVDQPARDAGTQARSTQR